MTYQCPLCHLRYAWAAELDDHARADHQPVVLDEARDHITAHHDVKPARRYVTPSM